jgi:zinc transport system substrate-binding protein
MSLIRSAIFRAALISSCLGLSVTAHAGNAPKVVASIKPIHSIAAAIMKGVGTPELLVDGAASPHTYSLRPSQARSLSQADLVIYVSHDLEHFLVKSLGSLSGKAHILELADAKGIKTMPMREGGAWEPHMHEGEHADDDHDHHDHEGADDEDHHHDHGDNDPHIWLDPANGEAIAHNIADELSTIDPAHTDTYQKNLTDFVGNLDRLEQDLDQKISPVREKPYIVFHDAYHYLERGFGLHAAGSITVSPDRTPGAKRLHEIEEKIRSTGAACVFAEPQFRPAIVNSIVADTGARTGTLDPLGADIPAGPDAYGEILTRNIDALYTCLKG